MKIKSERIRTLMDVNLMTQGDLAESAGLSRATVNTVLLKGSCRPVTAKKIADVLNVNLLEICDTKE
ncbi:MAG: helix-turn-helix transcriptional regulator [Emergencia sp.]|nr:helix-turn-helix transcriptional regulator [Emergencia sp.]